MLERLLTELGRGGSWTPALLARQLDLPVEIVEAMLEQLQRMGRIRSFAPDCASSCQACSMADNCRIPTGQPTLWTLV